MTLLAGTCYDPTGGAAVSKVTNAALAMTALDTTNLRLAFTAPSATYDGSHAAVLVRQRAAVHGATAFPQVLFGILESTTVKSRVAPIGAQKQTALATSQLGLEALYVVPGLTPGGSLTWDAAYGVETNVASTGLKYGGPDGSSSDDAFGGYCFEIYDTPNLLGACLYDPAAAVSKSCAAAAAMTAFDTTNLRIAFTVPASGKVLVRIKTITHGSTTWPAILLGVLESGTGLRGRSAPVGGISGTGTGQGFVPQESSFVVTGLTPGASLTWDAAYSVELLNATSAIKYGGPNNTTTNDAFGAIQYEIWAV